MMVDLADIGDDLVTYLNLYIYEVEHATDAGQQAAAAGAVSQYYEALGICELLLDAEIDSFFHHLIRSAQARVWLLQRSRQADYPRKALKASRVRPFFDAIIATQFDLAHEIARLSPAEWFEEAEYEDDFCYAHFLYRYLLNDTPADLQAVLDRFETVLEGASSSQLDLCKALLQPEQTPSEAAFLGLLEAREVHIEKIKTESAYWDGRDALLYPNTVVYIEGLAWLRLLERAGIVLPEEYLYCPSLVRRTQYAPFQVTTFPYRPLP